MDYYLHSYFQAFLLRILVSDVSSTHIFGQNKNPVFPALAVYSLSSILCPVPSISLTHNSNSPQPYTPSFHERETSMTENVVTLMKNSGKSRFLGPNSGARAS